MPSPATAKRFLEAGMDDYVSKPIDERKLIEIINRMTPANFPA
jgi:CheY-like chemotaxis protein